MTENSTVTYGKALRLAGALAEVTLRNYWTPGGFPVDPIRIARSAGVDVYDSRLGRDRWGMLLGGDNSATMYLDARQPPSRKRFSAAHELGHYMTHAAVEGFDGFNVKPLRTGEGYADARSDENEENVFEAMANEFASSLLMPETKFRDLKTSGNSVIGIASYFKVPVDAASLRARLPGLTTGPVPV